MNTRAQRPSMLSLEQAAQAAPAFAALQDRIRESQLCMKLIECHIPASLRTHVKAGPIDEHQWCLLVVNTAASTKLRQLLPTFLLALARAGSQVNAIRIKVQTGH